MIMMLAPNNSPSSNKTAVCQFLSFFRTIPIVDRETTPSALLCVFVMFLWKFNLFLNIYLWFLLMKIIDFLI